MGKEFIDLGIRRSYAKTKLLLIKKLVRESEISFEQVDSLKMIRHNEKTDLINKKFEIFIALNRGLLNDLERKIKGN